MSAPCIPFDPTARHCLAALLFGAACCPDGECALCRTDRARRQKLGFSPCEVNRRFAREQARLLDRCPRCGYPPPPPLQEMPEFPRLPRTGQADRFTCRICNRTLTQGRRRYCSDTCWREHVRQTEMEGDDVISPAPPRAYRAHLDPHAHAE